MAEFWELSAEEAVRRLTVGDVSPLELVDASITRIEAVDGAVNALPLHRFERARDDAKRLGELPPSDRGLLAGLPIAIKDLIDVEGMRTTYGCPLYADNVATQSDPLVTR
ncbi:MAG: amidase family protein, partial [Alphaproteobacteria bacterium]|nr:amidase family protein [Alphaproteobacteria bacterium]